MGIADLFRPKHRHSDASVRAEAVRQMGDEQAELIAEIARSDREASVRRVAIERIDDPAVLAELGGAEADPQVRELARRRAAEAWIARAVDAIDAAAARLAIEDLAALGDQRALAEVAARAETAKVREEAIALLDDPRALAELARSAQQSEVRITAVGRIESAEVLRSIAIDERRKDVAVAALDGIDDPEMLEELAARAKAKAVRNKARKKLAARERQSTDEADLAARRVHAERVQLIRIVEDLSTGHEWVESYSQVQEAETSWKALGEPSDASLQARFEGAVSRYRRRRDRYGAAAQRRAEQEARRRAEAAAAEAEPERQAEPESAPGAEAGGEAERGERADAPADAAAADPDEDSSARSSDARGSDDEARGSDDEARGSDDEARGSGGDTGRSAAARRDPERQREELARLEAACEDLERAASATSLKKAERILQEAQRLRGQLSLPRGDERRRLEDRFETARQQLLIRVRELREADEWQRWANVTRREDLIRRAEALLADADDERLGERLKELQAEWKATGPAPRDRSQKLWEQFKSTCDQVYERVRAQRERIAGERAANLEKKVALCERAEAIADSTDWEATAAELKGLQAEWKTIGPVPRRDSKKIWQRFRAACDRFFERRKPHLEETLAEQEKNLERKQELCERAEALAESTDWKETAAELRELQKRWRDIGLVPRKDLGPVTERFRAACDRFFARRQEHFEAQKAEKLAEVKQLADDVEALLDAGWDAPPPDEMARRTLEVRSRYRRLADEVDAGALAGIGDRIERLSAQVVADHGAELAGTELDPEASRRKKEKLAERAEELAPEPAPAEAAETPEEMAERLRAALADNALGLGAAGGRPVTEIIDELRQDWRRVGPVPGPEGAALEERFHKACARALQQAGAQGREPDSAVSN